MTQPYGIIFVCGPTGSRKTTTLHSAVSYINKTETKIWTAEDPVVPCTLHGLATGSVIHIEVERVRLLEWILWRYGNKNWRKDRQP